MTIIQLRQGVNGIDSKVEGTYFWTSTIERNLLPDGAT